MRSLHGCMISYMGSPANANWLLLVISLPTSSATGRMRIWRALKALGCVALRTGKKIEWDAHKMEAKNCPEAAQFIKRQDRTGWALS